MSEVCPYAENDFCASLTDEWKTALCPKCRIKSYLANQLYDISYWGRGPALLVDGFVVLGEGPRVESSEKSFVAREYVHTGEFVCTGDIFHTDEEYPFINEALCMTDCDLALIDYDSFRNLLHTDARFCVTVATTCIAGWGQAEGHLSCDTAYKKVRYFLQYCRQNRLPQFTHEQIATACNLSRQTVTKLMGEITKKEPELLG